MKETLAFYIFFFRVCLFFLLLYADLDVIDKTRPADSVSLFSVLPLPGSCAFCVV